MKPKTTKTCPKCLSRMVMIEGSLRWICSRCLYVLSIKRKEKEDED